MFGLSDPYFGTSWHGMDDNVVQQVINEYERDGELEDLETRVRNRQPLSEGLVEYLSQEE